MINPAPRKNTISEFLKWHYKEASSFILKVYKNFLVFNLNYFSVPLLFKTLFSHWRRYKDSYGRGFDIKRYIKTFFFNSISRILGAVVRSIIIIFALILEVLILVLGLAIFILWLLLPFLIIILIFSGISLL